MSLASTAAWAEPSNTLQIRLTVVEACSAGTGSTGCAVPHQRSDAAQLPPQVRELAPPATDDDETPTVTVIY
ncbi:hypothetical protein [Stenotrophomonas sp. ATs4]|uniref:hypothetical protein n=1 Tax=Stenotrophomonas sp. ATs4 TaxID=3402766 RepID=UPI003F6FC70E